MFKIRKMVSAALVAKVVAEARKPENQERARRMFEEFKAKRAAKAAPPTADAPTAAAPTAAARQAPPAQPTTAR